MAHGKELLLLLSLTMEQLADLSRSGQVCRVVAVTVAVIHPGYVRSTVTQPLELSWPGWPGGELDGAAAVLHPDGARSARNAGSPAVLSCLRQRLR